MSRRSSNVPPADAKKRMKILSGGALAVATLKPPVPSGGDYCAKPVTSAMIVEITEACNLPVDVCDIVAQYASGVVVLIVTTPVIGGPSTTNVVCGDGDASQNTSCTSVDRRVRDIRIADSTGHAWFLKRHTHPLEQRRLCVNRVSYPSVCLAERPDTELSYPDEYTSIVTAPCTGPARVDELCLHGNIAWSYPLSAREGLAANLAVTVLSNEQRKVLQNRREEWNLDDDASPDLICLVVKPNPLRLLIVSQSQNRSKRVLGVLSGIPSFFWMQPISCNDDGNLRFMAMSYFAATGGGLFVITVAPRGRISSVGPRSESAALPTPWPLVMSTKLMYAMTYTGFGDAACIGHLESVVLGGGRWIYFPNDDSGACHYDFGSITHIDHYGHPKIAIDGIQVMSQMSEQWSSHYGGRIAYAGGALFTIIHGAPLSFVARFDRHPETRRWTFVRTIFEFGETLSSSFDAAVL